MRKLAISMAILALTVGITIALAQPHGPPPQQPPPGAPQPGWGPPSGGPGGPPPGGPEGMGPGGMRENRGMMWEKFRQEHPEDARVLTEMMGKYPELKMIMGLGEGPEGPGEPGRMGHMERRDPEAAERMKKIFTLRMQAKELGVKYSHSKNAEEKKKIETELRAVLAQLYDLRLAEMKSRVEHVEEKLGEVKEDLSKFEKDRNGVIESWFKQLTGKEDYKTF